MNSVNWKENLELVGIVASLVFVGLQLRQSETATLVGFGDNETLHDFAWFLYKNPGVRATWSKTVDDEIERRDLLVTSTVFDTVTHKYPLYSKSLGVASTD